MAMETNTLNKHTTLTRASPVLGELNTPATLIMTSKLEKLFMSKQSHMVTKESFMSLQTPMTVILKRMISMDKEHICRISTVDTHFCISNLPSRTTDSTLVPLYFAKCVLKLRSIDPSKNM